MFGNTPAVAAHVWISLFAIALGLIALYGMITNQRMRRINQVFLGLTILTSVTGFFLPADKILPSHITGVISLVVLAIAVYAHDLRKLAGGARGTYVVTGVMALYLNCFVLVVQLFLKIPSLKAMAPTQSEPPFLAAQGATLVLFVILGVVAFKRFRPA
ncbi:hypothetical protein BWI17_06985 [Betaproteobacteria bacterium GR16-43]|nr:hypothetical protein BWI17_06985 [Betaproteobacteria bacterium GR16-43]